MEHPERIELSSTGWKPVIIAAIRWMRFVRNAWIRTRLQDS
ncbi:hypothetical protein PP427_gp178 [Salmonella phage KM16]|nr:hypothetical protein PP427_gp178 [Salmonella phage KM16]